MTNPLHSVDNQLALAALARGLRRDPGFRWYAVRCPEGRVEAALVDRLLAMSGRDGLQRLVHRDVATDAAPEGAFDSPDGGLIVTGLGKHLADDVRATRAAGDLNLGRNALPRRIRGALVVVAPSSLIDVLARGAPDLWSTRTAVLTLVDPEAAAATEAPPLSKAPGPRTVAALAQLASLPEGSDTEAARLGLLIRVARAAMDDNAFDEADHAAAEAGSLAARRNDDSARTAAATLRSNALLRRGAPLDALAAAEDAQRAAARAKAPHAMGDAALQTGKVLFRLGRNDDALAAFQAADAGYRQVGAALGVANAALQIGTVLFRLGRNDDALAAFQAADAGYRQVGNALGGASAGMQIARILAITDPAAALLALDEVSATERRIGAVHNLAITLRRQADLHERLGNAEAAARLRAEADALR